MVLSTLMGSQATFTVTDWIGATGRVATSNGSISSLEIVAT